MADARPPLFAVLAPMALELGPVRGALDLRAGADGFPGLSGRLAGADVVARQIGVGTERARRATEVVLDERPVAHVLVVGVAGGIGTARLRDLVVPEVVVDGASGDEFRPHHLVGQGRGRLRTSDEFVTDPERLGDLVARGVTFLDMETAAVARVCEARGVAWSVVRAVSDLATDHHDDAVFRTLRPDGSIDLAATARLVATRPARTRAFLAMARNGRAAARRAAATAAEHLRSAAARAG